MREIISEYGRAFLAALAVVALIVISYSFFSGQLKESLIQYDEKIYGCVLTTSINIGGFL